MAPEARRQPPAAAAIPAEAAALRDQFLANVSHDLRTPLAVIETSLGVVLANAPPGMPEPLHRLLLHAATAAARLTHLVNDLIMLTRLQAGRVPLERGDCDLNAIVRRAARRIGPRAQAREQQILLELPRRPVWAPADAAWLEQALLSLLDNAQRFGRAGGRICVRLRRERGEVVLSVTDDGPGVSAADRERIFEPFCRAEDDAGAGGVDCRDHPSGTAAGRGISLAIARAIVQWHNGRLTVDSVPGAGATFSIVLAVPAPPKTLTHLQAARQHRAGLSDSTTQAHAAGARSPKNGMVARRQR